ncbi:MAG: lysophospholipase [Gemmatimonadota bacterium]|nr:lysophospholipase [Gemmatimonadota bacterium]
MRALFRRVFHIFVLLGSVVLFLATLGLIVAVAVIPLAENKIDWFPAVLALPGAVALLFLAETLRTRQRSLRETDCPGFYVEGRVLTPCSASTVVDMPSEAEAAAVQRVVTLVHGTFARHAEWMRDQETFSAKLLDQLPNTRLSRFCWSGANSHTARLAAGEQLATHLRQLLEQFPGAQHFVAAHSHGGNVALYAMKAPNREEGMRDVLGDRFAGVITLATPFVALRPRPLPPVIRVSVKFTLVFALAMILYSVFTEGPAQAQFLGLREWSNAIFLGVLFVGWLIATAISATLYRGREFRFLRLLRLSLRGKDEPERKRILDAELDRLQPEKSVMDRLLVVRPLGDEASMGLVVSQFFSYAQNRIIQALGSARSFLLSRSANHSGGAGRSRTARFILLTAKLAVLTLLLVWLARNYSLERQLIYDDFLGDLLRVEQDTLLFSMIAAPIMAVLAVYIAFSIASLLGLLGLLFSAIPFGLDAMFWNHFASTTVEAAPLGTSPTQIFVGAGSGEGLAHSGIYLDDDAIDQVIAWIRGRPAAQVT